MPTGDTTHSLVNRSSVHLAYSRRGSSRSIPIDTAREHFIPSAFGSSTTSWPTSERQDGRLGRLLQLKVMGFSLLASFDDKDISTDLLSSHVERSRGRRLAGPSSFPSASAQRPAGGHKSTSSSTSTEVPRRAAHPRWPPQTSLSSVRAMAAMTSHFSRCRQRIMICCPTGSAPSKKTYASWRS